MALRDVLKNPHQTDAFAVAVFGFSRAAHPNASRHGGHQWQLQIPGLASALCIFYGGSNLGAGLWREECNGLIQRGAVAVGHIVDAAGLV